MINNINSITVHVVDSYFPAPNHNKYACNNHCMQLEMMEVQ